MPASVFFRPPLFLQRQRWIISELAKSRAKNILEVGCGDAPLLQAILGQPLWIDPSTSWREAFARKTCLPGHKFLEPPTVAPRLYTAIDVDSAALRLAADYVEEQRAHEARDMENAPRWEHLRVQLIHGTFEDDYTDMTGHVDVAVACEVIEHLDEKSFAQFPNAILGTYRPHKLLVTTPNYLFNTKFGNERLNQYKDPTGRTDRYFRHHDHKFEWSPAEFRAWCEAVCRTYPYTVEVGGVGVGLTTNSNGSTGRTVDANANAAFASQHALFTRLSDADSSGSSASTIDPLARTIEEPGYDADSLGSVTTFDFPATDMSASPSSTDVARETRDAILYVGRVAEPDSSGSHDDPAGIMYEATLWELWMDETLRRACCGRLDIWLPDPNMLDSLIAFGLTWSVGDDDVFLKWQQQMPSVPPLDAPPNGQ